MKTTLIDTKMKQSEWNPGRLRAVGTFHYLPNIVGQLFWQLTLTASASDNVPVANVQFQVDGTNVGAPDTISPYSFSSDTTRCRAASIASRPSRWAVRPLQPPRLGPEQAISARYSMENR